MTMELLLPLLLLLSCCVQAITSDSQQDQYPIYRGNGSHYENGFAIGSQAKQRIQKYIDANPIMQQLRFCLLTGCSVNFRNLVEYNQKIYAQYFDELQGMADGADVDVGDLQLLSFQYEIMAAQQSAFNTELLQCSDVYLNGADFKGFAHNEDGWNGTMEYAYFAHYNISNGTQNEFFAFQYPASIVGHAFGVNRFGVAVSMNAVFPTNVTIPARGVYFVSRALMDARNISDAVRIISDSDDENGAICAYGASFNIGYKNNENQVSIANIEVSSYNFSVEYYGIEEQADSNAGYHFNMYLRLNVSQKNDTSSVERLQQIIDENGLNKGQDLIDVLGDTQNPEYPLYRTSKAPDTASTLSTVLFDLQQQTMHVYDKCNPKSCAPALNISFDSFL